MANYTIKLSVIRLCYAVGLATRQQASRWVAIEEVFALLSAADRADETWLLDAAVVSGLVSVNSGPAAHFIQLTEAGLDAYQRAANARSALAGEPLGPRQ